MIPLKAIHSPLFHNQKALFHGFMTRQGGVSTGTLSSGLNFRGQGDDQSTIMENRRRLELFFNVPKGHILYPRQVHGDNVLTLSTPFPMTPHRPEGDALVTSTPDLAIGVITADCVPVLLYDPKNRVIGAVHAGWRGARGGILNNTIAAMARLGASVKTTMAAIGPCIQQKSYTVGEEVRDLFCRDNPMANRFFKIARQQHYFQLDIPGFVYHSLLDLGLSFVDRLNHDTYTAPSQFYSCRKAAHTGGSTLYGCQFSGLVLR